jgi:hypothetical protein
VRVSAKRQEAPLFLLPEQVKLGLTQLQFRDQLLVFLDGALGTRRGELGALRWSDCNFDSMSFSVQHSYYWRRGGHLKATKTESSAKALPMHVALKDALLEWKSQNEYNGPGDFVFPSRRHKGRKPLDLAAVLKKKIQSPFARVGIIGVGWHTFRRTVWDDAGRDGRTSTHDQGLLTSQQSPCDEQVSSGDTGAEAPGARKIGRCDLARWFAAGEQINSDSVVGAGGRVLGFVRGNARRAECCEPLLDPNGPRFFAGFAVSA